MRTLHTEPYTSPLLNITLRTGPRKIETPSVSTIAVAGALFDKGYNLFHDDEVTIKRTLDVLSRAGVGVASVPSFKFYNLLAPLKNDFLGAALDSEKALQADLLIVCGIHNTRVSDALISRMHPLQRDYAYENFENLYDDFSQGFNHNREISISPHQMDERSWARAADRAGIKIVVTRGGSHDEICSHDFLRGDFYRVAIGTPEKFERMDTIISGHLGIVVHKDSVESLKRTADPQDVLGQRILAL